MPPETEAFTPDQFVTGNFPIVTEPVTILSGQGAVAARTVLGRITASGKWVKSLAASNDGSEVPRAILAVAVDATAADAVGPAYKAGQFDPAGLVVGAGHDMASVAAAFEGTPLFLRSLV